MDSSLPPKTPDPVRVIVLADDLSGAAELAGIAFARGYSAEVQRQFDPASDARVIAVDTDSRGLTPQTAANRVENVARAIVAARPAWIFKKVDSVLRGNVRVEIEALLRVTGHSRALLAPANPSRGRVIQGGRYWIDGVPLAETTFRSDPEHPRRSSAIAELLGPSETILVPDVTEAAHLQVFAEKLASDTMPGGAADFFAAILDARGVEQSRANVPTAAARVERLALLVCGSPAAWFHRQQECGAAGVPMALVHNPDEQGETWALNAAARLQKRGILAVGIGDASTPPALSVLASAAGAILERARVATILIEGGATAAALAERLSWNRLRVVAAAPDGVGVLVPIGAAASPRLFIKPGSYAWPGEIWRQIAQPE